MILERLGKVKNGERNENRKLSKRRKKERERKAFPGNGKETLYKYFWNVDIAGNLYIANAIREKSSAHRHLTQYRIKLHW